MDTVMEKVIEAGFEYLRDQVRWQTGMKEELQRLRDIHPKIQAVVAYASTQLQIRDQNSALDKWLWQLRDAIDEADDVLDDLEYKKHGEQLAKNTEKEEQLTGNMEETKKRKFPFIPSFMSSMYESARNKIRKVGERALKNDPNLKRLEEVVQKLDKVSAGVDTFISLVTDAKQGQREQQEELYRARETGAIPKNDQIGRAKEKDFVLQWLKTKPSNEQQTTLIAGTARYSKISLLSVVGLGGMGKTTLLQHVYEDETTNKEFDLKMWVCVSNNFDVKTVIAAMLESLKKKKPDLESLNALQDSLKSEVSSKKFLLVLDDIWDIEKEEERNIHENKWENVLAPLAHGSFGSKILVTTRMDLAASTIANVIKKKKETLTLKGLEEAECLRLFNSYAFVGVENPDDHSNLRSIAGEIVKKFSGSPLAARVMGGVLKDNLDESHWKRVLNSDFRSADSAQSVITSILRLSYIFLPKHLQNCFAFCCIFPQDHRFNKDDLVQMWTALNFIQPIHGGTEKDTGERYFDVLIKKSLFDKFQIKNKTYYKIHDLLHDMLRSISAHECSNIVGDNEELVSEIPNTIRHLSVETDNPRVIIKMKKFKHLHSLYFYGNCVNALDDIFKTSKSIRLLSIHDPSGDPRDQLIERIGELIHLRCLKIVKTGATLLPRSLSNLYHLKKLELSLESLQSLPSLSSLKILRLKNIPQLQVLPNLPASLEELQLLYLDSLDCLPSCLPSLSSLKKLHIYHVPQLRELPDLPPSLCELDLWNLKNLDCLPSCLPSLSSLKTLDIDNVPQLRELPDLPPSLCKLELSSLDNLDCLPSWLPSLSSLKELYIWDVPQLRELPDLPPCLCLLCLRNLKNLDCLPSCLPSLSSLKELHISHVPQLRELPDLPPSLCELKLMSLYNLDCLPSCLPSLSSLKTLHIGQVPQLRELPDLPRSLESLQIKEGCHPELIKGWRR